MITARHAEVPENELREEGQVEAEEDDQRAGAPPHLRIDAPRDLRPPVMKPGEERRHHSAHHHVMEMRDHEIGLREVHVGAECGDEQTRSEELTSELQSRFGISYA